MKCKYCGSTNDIIATFYRENGKIIVLEEGVCKECRNKLILKPIPGQRRKYTLSQSTKIKMSLVRKNKPRMDFRGPNSPNWKGGITAFQNTLRDSLQNKQWRSNVFERDNWTCQTCQAKGVYLEAHHKKQFSIIIRENNITTLEQAINCKPLWDINNGVTLCKDCHKLTRKGENRG